jgi:hypothetical protein
MTMRSTSWKPWRSKALFASLAIAVLSGCSDGRPERVPVSGKVLIDGQPLETGNIRVYAAANRAASGKIEPDGSFKLSTYEFGDGVVPGTHMVSVTASKLLNPKTVRWLAPKKFSDASTSGLTLEVTEPTSEAQIDLTWDGGKPFNETILGGGD